MYVQCRPSGTPTRPGKDSRGPLAAVRRGPLAGWEELLLVAERAALRVGTTVDQDHDPVDERPESAPPAGEELGERDAGVPGVEAAGAEPAQQDLQQAGDHLGLVRVRQAGPRAYALRRVVVTGVSGV